MTQDTKTTGKWRSWLLIGSLALNLIIIGAIAGSALRGPDRAPRGKMTQPDLLRDLVQAVPKDQRGELRKDLNAKRDELRGMRTEMQSRRQDLVRVLVSPEFDISQIVAIFDDHRVILSRIASGGHEIIIRRIEAMSPEEREEFAQNIERYQDRRRKSK